MSRRAVGLALLGLAAYAIFLAALLPARVVTSRLVLPPGLSLEAVEGTVWNGRAHLSGRTINPHAVAELRWHWQPAALLSGRMAYEVVASGHNLDARGIVAHGLRAGSLEDFTLDADAASIAPWIPLASAWQPAGRVRARIERLAWDGRDLQGHAEAQWSDAALALSSVKPVGAYTIKLEGAGGPARVTVGTVKGPLRVSGDGTVEGVAHFAFTGEARAEGPDAAALTPLLDLLGPRRPDGSRALRFAA
jgi:general secretion pathway protein N